MDFRSTPMGRALFGKAGDNIEKSNQKHLLRTATETINNSKNANEKTP